MKRSTKYLSCFFVFVLGCAFVLFSVGCNETPVGVEEPVTSTREERATLLEARLNQRVEAIAALFEQDLTDAQAIAAAGKSAASVVLVRSDASIQAAVDQAAPGSFLLIQPGLYRETVLVETPGLTLLGLGGPNHGVVIENPGDEDDGIRVRSAGDGFTLANVTVRGFEENGVFLIGVEGFLLFRVRTEDNGEYGLFPVRSSLGAIVECSAVGHTDAGIYVGVSTDVLVRHSSAYGNVIGFEIENSSNIVVSHNKSFGNTAGALLVLLPGLSVKTASDVFVMHNRLTENNLPNFAEPGELASVVPSGSGLLVLGTDRALIGHNRVQGNDFVGIGVGSVCTLASLLGVPCEDFAVDIDPDSDGAEVLGNRATGNGTNPPPLPLPGADLFWDGTGTGNCWQANVFDTSFPVDLPAC